MRSSDTRIYVVVLCGGNGTRLWPLSSPSKPKQFLDLIHGKSLLNLTLSRAIKIAKKINQNGEHNIILVGNVNHKFHLDEVASCFPERIKILLEPISRNTAPAISSASFFINSLNDDKDNLVLFMPADHHIPDVDLFCKKIEDGINCALDNNIVTFGVKSKSPHTGYGYIQTEPTDSNALDVISFHEKPELSIAKKFHKNPKFFWNSGIFLAKNNVFLESLREFANEIYSQTYKSFIGGYFRKNIFSPSLDSYIECIAESFDYSVLEKYNNLKLIPFDGEWSDIGNWNAVSDRNIKDSKGNAAIGDVRFYDSENSFVHSKDKQTVVVGLSNINIISTENKLLVVDREHVEKIKDINLDSHMANRNSGFAERPWGSFKVIDEGKFFKVKRLLINPGHCISLQLHNYRAEHWTIIRGRAKVERDGESYTLCTNESTFIPQGSKHRLTNESYEPLEMIEVQTGEFLSEDDIIRFEDIYGRT